MKRWYASYTRLALVTALLMITVMAVDRALGNHYHLLWTGLEWPADINELLAEVWFAQSLALVALPALLLLYVGRSGAKRALPWVIVSSVLALSFAAHVYANYHQTVLASPAWTTTELIHHGAVFHGVIIDPYGHDDLIEGRYPTFLLNELVVLGLLGGALTIDKRRHNHVKPLN